MAERTATYSRIISPENYNRIITSEHLYIAASDKVIHSFIEAYRPKDRIAEVIEIGCGPARVLPLMRDIPDIHLVGIDHDPVFVEYARKALSTAGSKVEVVHGDIALIRFERPVDIFYSQGVHHHIAKGIDTRTYLDSVHGQLAERGVYIVSDEFLPEYGDEHDRRVKAVIWYSHIISHAQKHHYEYLAQEEAKTLLDDLHEGVADDVGLKNIAQIQLVLDECERITDGPTAEAFLRKLAALRTGECSGDETVDLSRGDYKVCDSVFRREVENAGFEVIKRETCGLVDTIGGMAIYVLRKHA